MREMRFMVGLASLGGEEGLTFLYMIGFRARNNEVIIPEDVMVCYSHQHFEAFHTRLQTDGVSYDGLVALRNAFMRHQDRLPATHINRAGHYQGAHALFTGNILLAALGLVSSALISGPEITD